MMTLTTNDAIAICSFIVSIIALVQSRSIAKKTRKLEVRNIKLQQSNILSELHDKMRPGRQAMESIWIEWNTDASKQPGSLSDKQKQEFIHRYNKYYHHGSDRRKDLSDAIHTYLHELNSLWHHIDTEVFDKHDVMQKLGDGIFLDRHFIRLYLEAHWQDENQLVKDVKDRFWSNVLTIVHEAEAWKMSKASIT